jgi:type I restriction enzyme, R subunit
MSNAMVGQKTARNFAFLAVHCTQMVRLAALAEHFFHEDPATSLVKLRQFAELLAKTIAARHSIEVEVDLL